MVQFEPGLFFDIRTPFDWVEFLFNDAVSTLGVKDDFVGRVFEDD